MLDHETIDPNTCPALDLPLADRDALPLRRPPRREPEQHPQTMRTLPHLREQFVELRRR